MRSLDTKVTWPEFCSFKSRCVDFKLLRLEVEGGRSLKTCYIRAMTKLCLSVATNYLPVVDLRHPVAYLLFVSEHKDAFGEHLHMECHGIGASKMVVPVPILALFVSVVRDNVSELFILKYDFMALPPELQFLGFSHLIVLKWSLEFWVLCYKLLKNSALSVLILCVEHIECRISVKVALCALLQYVWINNSTRNASSHCCWVPIIGRSLLLSLYWGLISHLFLTEHFKYYLAGFILWPKLS